MVLERHKRSIVVTAASGSFLAPFMVSGLIVALPAIATEMSLDAVALGWLTAAFFLSATAFLIPFGRLADISGVKNMFRNGIVIYVFSSLLCGLAPTALVLLAGRLLAGAGAAMIFSKSIALLSLVFPPSDRGKMIGINVTAMVGGFASGFLLGGLFTYYIGWRMIFLVTVPVSLAVLAVIRWGIPGECALSHRKRPDTLEMICYSLALILIMAGLTIVTSLPGFTAFLAGSVLLALLVRSSRRVENPVLDPGLFQSDPRFSTANLAILVFNTGGFAVVLLLSLFLQYIQGYDARFAGLILIILPAFMALAFIGGRLSDRINPWIVAAVGATLSAVGLCILIFLDAGTPLAVIVITLALIGTGIAFFQPSIVNTVMGSVPREVYGLASGTAETMRLAGMTLSTAIATVGFGIYIGAGGISPQNYPAFLDSLKILFLVYFLISLSCIAISLFVGRQRSQSAPT